MEPQQLQKHQLQPTNAQANNSTEIFVGNLNRQLNNNTLKREIAGFFSDEIEITKEKIDIIRKARNCFGFFDANSLHIQKTIISKYNGLEGLDFVSQGKRLHVAARLFRFDATPCQPLNTSAQNQNSQPSGHVQISSSQSSPTIGARLTNVSTGYPEAAYTGSRIYWLGTMLPHTEDRVTEYKVGGGNYLQRRFINHVRKYMCAFLNGTGGQLLIGISDDCIVHGVECGRKLEDTIRLKIDNVIRHFRPTVFPECYDVSFPRVCNTTVTPSGSQMGHLTALKVIEITVHYPSSGGNASVLYEDDRGAVFIRRDGSVQGPLRASEIIEWCRLKLPKTNGQRPGNHHMYATPHDGVNSDSPFTYSTDNTSRNQAVTCTIL